MDTKVVLQKTITMVVICHNCAGEPDMFMTEVNVTQKEFRLGGHYEKARENAMESGYENPMIIFDPLEYGRLKHNLKEIPTKEADVSAWCRNAQQNQAEDSGDIARVSA